MSYKPRHQHTPEALLEIGRKYEEGKKLRGKVMCHEHGISRHVLLASAAAYRKTLKAAP